MKTDASLMTKGPIYPQIIHFAVPLFWGQLFQQLYNIVDSVVVGNFVGRNALAAVSSTSALVFLLVGFFLGTFTGCGVVISKYYGAERNDLVHTAVHTSVALGLVSGVLLTIIGVVFTPYFLRWMDTPADVLPEAILYLRIYFMGSLALTLFDSASGIFQAIGDSKHPLYYLIFASVTNIVLNILFVAVFRMGVAGSALATVISQTSGVAIAFYRLCRTNEINRVTLREVRFNKEILQEELRTGLPSGVQNSVISIANIVVQSKINAFGSATMAGCGVFQKIEGFAFIPITSFSMAITTFIGQNLGASKYERAKKGAWFAIIVSCVLAEIFGVLYYFTAPQLIALFNKEAGVIAVGTLEAQILCFFFFLLSFSHCVAGIMRGAGRAAVPMLTMFGCWCVIRVTYISIVTGFTSNIKAVFWAYPLTWFLSGLVFLVYLLKSDWVHSFDKEKSLSSLR